MTPERLRREQDIFHKAVNLRPGDRPAYLAEACHGDPELRAEVEALLAADEKVETEEFLPGASSGGPAPPPGGIPQEVPDFDDYRDIKYIGHGGMGVVYRAFDKWLNKNVALKMPLPDLALSADHFIREPQNIARLHHPNIVQVHKVGEHQGRSYFTMNLIEGPSLEKHLGDHPRDPRTVAALMVKVARAVHHAHQRGILHRDLKPGNILLDPDGEPLVTDFGLATNFVVPGVPGPDVVAPGNTASRSIQRIVGTIPFLSPEQAEPPKEVTTLSDVYGLGAILYALLTGRPPFRGENVLETLRLVRDPGSTPEPPRALNPRVDLDLQAVCLKCLDKDPVRRYRSAEGLARDLERWMDGKETEARRWGLVERGLRACRRYPIAAALTATAAALLVATAVTAASVAQARKERLEEEALRGNAYAAYGMASAVLWQLEDWSDHVVQTAQDPRLRGLLKAGDPERLRRYLEDPDNRSLRRGAGSPFESWYVEDKEGKLLAVSPRNERIIRASYAGRDYFRGAVQHAREGRTGRGSVHVSRVFKADNDGLIKFALSAPVRDGDAPDSPLLGVVAVTITTASTFGLVRLSDERRDAVLAGRSDTADPRPGQPAGLPEGYLILVHPRYARGEEPVQVSSKRIGEVGRPRPGAEFELQELDAFDPDSAKESNYSDPLDHRRQLIGFAQVGNTELVVLVQQPYDEVMEPHVTWAVASVACIGAATFLGLFLTGAVARTVGRRIADRAGRRDSAPAS